MTEDILYYNQDDYNYGIDENVNITIIQTDVGEMCLKQDEFKNPFFIKINEYPLKDVDNKELYSTYRQVYVLCMKDNFKNTHDVYNIYNSIISKNDLILIKNQFALIPASMILLWNKMFKDVCCIVEKEFIKHMFDMNFNTELSSILVIPMFELTESMAKLNISLYESKSDISTLKDIMNLTSFYNNDFKKPVLKQFSQILSSFKESQYWSNPENCNINMTKLFSLRRFNFKEIKDKRVRMSILSQNNIEKTKDLNNILDKLESKNNNYPTLEDEILDFDIFASLIEHGKRTYFMTNENNLKITKSDATNIILSITDETELYHIFNNLLVSKDYCHMVLNNFQVLNKAQHIIEKYKPLYKVLFGYAWLSFIIEENMMKTRTEAHNRYVFDINTANQLPSFPFVYDDLAQNPYISVLCDKKSLNPEKNASSLYCIESFDGYGVCNLDQFKWRFNIFTSGDPNKNIFDGLDWNTFAISGSLMPACLQKKSPLFDIVTRVEQREEDKWLTFFNHYYKDSDIDLMCNVQSIYEFTDQVDNVVTLLKKNIKDCSDKNINKNIDKDKDIEIEIEPVKSLTIMITNYFISESMIEFNKQYNNNINTVEQMIGQIQTQEMKEYLYLKYIENKSKVNNDIRKNKLDNNNYIKKFMNLSSIEDMNIQLISLENGKNYKKPTKLDEKTNDDSISIFVNDFRSDTNKVSDDQNYLVIKIHENIRFKIKSNKIARSIEVFRSKSKDFFSTVARFHLPCVRTYYTGNNVYILPSCITAMMTGINIDYKYFASIKNPVDIINKYRMRGFGTLLSPQELQHMIKFNHEVKDCGGMFNISELKECEILKSTSPQELTSKIYRPAIYIDGFPEDVYNVPHVTYIKQSSQLYEYYSKKYNYNNINFGFDVFTFKTITDIGNIMPYQNWLSTAYIERYEYNLKYNTTHNKKTKIIDNKSNDKQDFNHSIPEIVKLNDNYKQHKMNKMNKNKDKYM